MVNIKTLAVSLATVVLMGGTPVIGMTPSASAADAFSQAASVWPEDLLGATNTLVAFRAEITKPRGGAAAKSGETGARPQSGITGKTARNRRRTVRATARPRPVLVRKK